LGITSGEVYQPAEPWCKKELGRQRDRTGNVYRLGRAQAAHEGKITSRDSPVTLSTPFRFSPTTDTTHTTQQTELICVAT
jgi:hypothetical protein